MARKNIDTQAVKDLVKGSTEAVKDMFARSMSQAAATKGSVGVDIGNDAVKTVRLESFKDGRRLLGFGVEKVADRNYIDALSKSLAKAGATPDQAAAIAVSGQGVVSRYIELPLMNKGDLESSMRFEIEKYVPFALAEVATDYAIVQELKDKAKMSVLIVAAKNDLVQKKTELVRQIGMNLRAIDLDCLALANFFTEIVSSQKAGCVGLVNLGRTISNMNILVDGYPYLSRDIFVGGDDITKKLVETLEIEAAEAERLKRTPGARQKELYSLWDPVLNNLAAEVRVSLDYFEARMNKTVEQVWITGGTSRLQGLVDYLHQLLGVEVRVMDYVDGLLCDEAVDRRVLKEEADLLAIAMGLALR
ncbi:MAG: type IV pilus assembly protein PilM [Deltaproteobacteria bacterium]